MGNHPEKIVSIVSHGGQLLGLDEEGSVWKKVNPPDSGPFWELYLSGDPLHTDMTELAALVDQLDDDDETMPDLAVVKGPDGLPDSP